MKSLSIWFRFCLPIAWLAIAPALPAQKQVQISSRPYLGFVYPAGGQPGTTFQIKVGGQGLNDLDKVLVSGTGVKARIIEYHRRLSPQDMQLLKDQLLDLRKIWKSGKASSTAIAEAVALKDRIMTRTAEFVQRPACASIANTVLIEITMAPDAKPGEREFRLETLTGISNPLVFEVGQFPEVSRKPMTTCEVQVLGKEELALRKRAPDEGVVPIKVPCTVNGQIASGEVDQYRFPARKGQQLVISVLARQLIPFIADAVPGWFQPVLKLRNSAGKELAYADEYRFKPDPIIFFTAPEDGEYVFSINDSIYRGREDFVYRITVGEQPYVTSIFPLGARVDDPVEIKMKGVNLESAVLHPPAKHAEPGILSLAGTREGLVLNRMPFEVDTLPECLEAEPNNDQEHAQKVTLPIIVNGRIEKPDDWDVFQFEGHRGQTIVAEVVARRLDSPLDSILKLTDATGAVLAFNDDREDEGDGINTHHADSYLMTTLPADGPYFVYLGDTARGGGEEFGYRLRISPPRPDFDLRVVPSSISLRGKSSATVSVHVIRKDGFTGPIQLKLAGAPRGIWAAPVTLTGTNQVAQLSIRSEWTPPQAPVNFDLSVVGSARVEDRVIAHPAVPAEDRMQAFLWRHLVPAQEMKAMVCNPNYKSPENLGPLILAGLAARSLVNSRAMVAARTTPDGTPSSPAPEPPKFTKKQVGSRIRDLTLLYQEGLLSNDFYVEKLAECESGF